MSKAIAGEVEDEVMNNAVIAAMGFVWNEENNSWSVEGAQQKYIDLCNRIGGTFPPSFISDDIASELLEYTLPQTEEIQAGLNDHIEVIFGEDITKISRKQCDKRFLRREVIVKWLHMYGEF